jgi:hypothetical protein
VTIAQIGSMAKSPAEFTCAYASCYRFPRQQPGQSSYSPDNKAKIIQLTNRQLTHIDKEPEHK